MSVLDIKRTKTTGPKLQGNADRSISGEITDEFQIIMSESPDVEGNIIVANELPGVLFGTHPDSNMFVQTYRDVEFVSKITQPGRGFIWNGTVKYTRRSRTRPQTPEPPLPNTPYSISFSFANRQEVLEVDRFGEVVCNSVGDKFDTPPMARVNEPTFTITRQEFWNPLQKLINYNPKYGAVNGNGIWFFNPRTLLLTIGADYQSEQGWTVKYQFTFNYDTWDYNALNAGYYFVDSNEKKRILDDTVDQRPVVLNAFRH